MAPLTLITLALLYGVVMAQFSAWSTKRQLSAQSRELNEPGLSSQLDAMARALDVPRIKVHLYEVDQINGLAAPDGRIFLTRGFLNRFRQGEVSGDELASVIAHELGHVALGHSRRRMIDFSTQNAMRTALALVLSRIIPGIGAYIANALTSLLAARLSRSDEYEADAYATALLIKAGIGAEAQKSMFRKLDHLTQNRMGAVPAWIMSHPKTPDRIAAIEANEARWRA